MATQRQLVPASSVSVEGPQTSVGSGSRIRELFRDPGFRLEWDNDLGFHVARNLQELRRHRGLTQAELADAAGTTQPKVALAESGAANLTLRTLVRYAEALDGRLRFSIEPSELNLPQAPTWWNVVQFLDIPVGAIWGQCEIRTTPPGAKNPIVGMAWSGEAIATEVSSYRLGAGQDSLFSNDFDLTAELTSVLPGPAPKKAVK